MRSHITSAIICALLVLTSSVAAFAAQAAVNVAVVASKEATVGISYSRGDAIWCRLTCTRAVVRGSIRSSAGARTTRIELRDFSVLATDGDHLSADPFRVSCAGGVIGTPLYAGTPLLQAHDATLAEPVICQSWSGALVADYELFVTLSVDSSRIAAGGDTAVRFNAIATLD